ncbi:hypothetical protein ACFOG5_24570 [Pedobacter fastidiosus]
MDVLNGEATDVQNNVVLCNSALAIKTIKPSATLLIAFMKQKNR